MSTDVIIGWFLTSDVDINSIVYSDRFVDTVCGIGDSGYYTSNHGNNVFHYTVGDQLEKPININDKIVNSAREDFLKEIKEITDILDSLSIFWKIEYGVMTNYL